MKKKSPQKEKYRYHNGYETNGNDIKPLNKKNNSRNGIKKDANVK